MFAKTLGSNSLRLCNSLKRSHVTETDENWSTYDRVRLFMLVVGVPVNFHFFHSPLLDGSTKGRHCFCPKFTYYVLTLLILRSKTTRGSICPLARMSQQYYISL